MNLYQNHASDPRANAQRNLSGRTHYVDDDTLRWHKARILSARSSTDGLLFYIVESVAIDPHNARRECRYVIFDLFGTIVGTRAELGAGWRRSEQASKAMYAELETLDARALTLAGIESAEKYHAQEMQRMRDKLAELSQERAA